LTLEMLNAGRSVALRDVSDMLSERGNERGRKLRGEDVERGRKVMSLGVVEEAEEDERRESVGWGVVAGDAVKVMGKFERVSGGGWSP
jgi:hypothetical protein